MTIQRLGVVGAGQMGAGIAQVSAMAGLQTRVTDVSQQRLQVGQQSVQSSLQRLVAGKRITSAVAQAAQERITWSLAVEDHADRQVVIEAVPENAELKQSVLQTLEESCAAGTLLASNTSSLSITALASGLSHPERFVGMHFMNPVPVMVLVEVIRGAATSDATCEQTIALADQLGKQTTVASDYPGFLSNRILMPMINEAFFTLMEGVGSAEDIDRTLTLGMNHPLGPLALADLIGLDTCLSILDILQHQLGDPKYRACPLLRRFVAAGWLGRKTGRGVFAYGDTP